MRRRGASRPPPLQAEARGGAAVDHDGPAPAGQLEGQRGGMGLPRGRARGRGGGIGDERGPPVVHPGKAHDRAARGARLHARGRKRAVQPALQPPAAAMEARQRPVGMAQAPQRGRNPLDRRRQRLRHLLVARPQRIADPGKLGQDLHQLLGTARGDAAVAVDLPDAVGGQGGDGRRREVLHALQREARVDQAGERLEPGQARRRGLPAAGQEQHLAGEAAEERRLPGGIAPLHQEDRVVDPADHPPPGHRGRPAGAAPGAVARDPGPGPVLRPGPRPRVAHRRQVIQPAEALQFQVEARAVLREVPELGARRLDHLAVEQEVAGEHLPPPRIVPDAERLGRGDEGPRPARTGQPPGLHPVQRLRDAPFPALDLGHLLAAHGYRGSGPLWLRPILAAQRADVTPWQASPCRSRRSRRSLPNGRAGCASRPRG